MMDAVVSKLAHINQLLITLNPFFNGSVTAGKLFDTVSQVPSLPRLNIHSHIDHGHDATQDHDPMPQLLSKEAGTHADMTTKLSGHMRAVRKSGHLGDHRQRVP